MFYAALADMPVSVILLLITNWLTIVALFDLAEDKDSKSLIRDIHEAGKIIAAICHGAIVFKDVKLSNGEFLVANSAVTGSVMKKRIGLG
jgi:hypothetical protein